jgi:hypothetical protein
MSDIDSALRALRDKGEFIDPASGRVIKKPDRPPMRQTIRGGWTYRELPADSESQTKSATIASE